MNVTELIELLPTEWELEETEEGHEIRMDTATEGYVDDEDSMGHQTQHVIVYEHGCNEEGVKHSQRDQANAIAGTIAAIPDFLALAEAVLEETSNNGRSRQDSVEILRGLANTAIAKAAQEVEKWRVIDREEEEQEEEINR